MGAGHRFQQHQGHETITYDLQVDPDISTSIQHITNEATLNSDSAGPFSASVTDDVFHPAVTVEPNNANFVVYDATNPQTITYSHTIRNTGDITDSFNISAMSMQGAAHPGSGWKLELIDPATGAVIATDTDFSNGIWDGGVTINTGSMAPGEEVHYDLRVTVPAGSAVGTTETDTLTAVSTSFSSISALATDDTVVADLNGDVVVVADQSGVITAGGNVVYPHTIFNNTGSTDVFDLNADSTESGWDAKIYNDSNGDGAYTPGVDVEISNSASLADGEHQLVFVVVTAPSGASPGDTEITHFTAISRNDTTIFDGVSDTTTVDPASTHDLSGGGTVLVSAGDDCSSGHGCPSFPGTLKSLENGSDVFDFSISASSFYGLDGLNHPTQLWIDTDGDGVVDTQIAEDSDGDGTWDSIAAGYDSNGDGKPDVGINGGDTLNYELKRPVDPAQGASRETVTLTTSSQSTGEKDSVTATNLLHSPTYAMLTDFHAGKSAAGIVLSWRTAEEIQTAGYRIERRLAGGHLQAIHTGLLPAAGNAPVGAHYRFLDRNTASDRALSYVLREIDWEGSTTVLAVISLPSDRDGLPTETEALPPSGFEMKQNLPDQARSPVREEPSEEPERPTEALSRIRVRTGEEGLQFLSADAIATAMGQSPATIESWISGRQLVLHRNNLDTIEICERETLTTGGIFSDGFENGTFCAWDQPGVPLNQDAVALYPKEDNSGVYFYAEALDSIYSNENIYELEFGASRIMASRNAAPDGIAERGSFVETRHFEEDGPYALTSVIEDPGADFWFWDYVFVNPAFGVEKNTISIDFETPGRSSGPHTATIRVNLQAESTDETIPDEHQAEIRLNGTSIGSGVWDGSTATTIALSFDQSLLADGHNTLEIFAPAASGIESELYYLDSFDLSYRRDNHADRDLIRISSEGRPELAVDGFTRSDLSIFDISDREHPIRIEGALIDGDSGSFRVSFVTNGGRDFLIQPLEKTGTPILEPDFPSSLHSTRNRADYVLIAGEGLEDAARELADYRSQSGFRPMLVRLQDIYDEFSRGIVDPFAVRDFIHFAVSSWETAPRDVVLIGDSSFDFKDHLGYGGNLLISPMVSTPDGLFPSDNLLADFLGDDGVPDVSLGRIPVRTAEELYTYIEKLRDFENSSAPWKQRTVWVADAADSGGEFIGDSEQLIGLIPDDFLVQRIYVDVLGENDARNDLLNSISEGGGLIHFLGHANLQQMGSGSGLLKVDDVPGLDNSNRQPVLTAMTCAMGRFDRVYFDTLGESLLLAPDGGITALLAPAGLSFNVDGVRLSEDLTPSILRGTPLGEAIRHSLEKYLEDAPEALAEVPYLTTLLGDPAMRIIR